MYSSESARLPHRLQNPELATLKDCSLPCVEPIPPGLSPSTPRCRSHTSDSPPLPSRPVPPHSPDPSLLPTSHPKPPPRRSWPVNASAAALAPAPPVLLSPPSCTSTVPPDNSDPAAHRP